VSAFGLVELERAGDGVQDGVGGAPEIAAFQTGVVLDADPGEEGDLLAAQTRHSPMPAPGRQPCLFGEPPGPRLATSTPARRHAGPN
jgi:hypothetical protein